MLQIKPKHAVVAVLVAALSWSAAPARAAAGDGDAAKAQAKELFKAGYTAYSAGQYEVALDLFRKAQAKFDREPRLVLALAKTYHKMQDAENAVRYYKLFLQLASTEGASTDTRKEDRDWATKSVVELEQALAKRPGVFHFKGLPPGAKVEVDGKSVEVPPSAKLEVSVGSHSVRVALDKRLPFERPAVVVRAGETAEIDVVLLAPMDPGSLPHDHTWTLVAGGATVAAVATGAVFGVLALQSQDDYYQIFDSSGHIRPEAASAFVQRDTSGAALQGTDGQPLKCTRGIAASACPDAIAEGKRLLDEFSGRRTAMWVSFGVGAALAAGTVVAYLKAPVIEAKPKSGPSARLQLLPMWDGQHTGALLTAAW
jgi:tetratricopeptide (TPR) repeat protein